MFIFATGSRGLHFFLTGALRNPTSLALNNYKTSLGIYDFI